MLRDDEDEARRECSVLRVGRQGMLTIPPPAAPP